MYLSLDQYFFECLKFNSRRQKIKAPGSFGLKINEQIKKKISHAFNLWKLI